jgi:hypothetical protein
MRTSRPVGRIRMAVDQLADEFVDVLRDVYLVDASLLGVRDCEEVGGQP